MIYTFGVHHSDFQETTKEFIFSYFKAKEWVAVDTETTGKDPYSDKIISLQLGDAENQFFIDCRKVNIQEFRPILQRRKLIIQNSKFEYKMLKMCDIHIENIYVTMLAECVLYCGHKSWGYGLDILIERYTGNKISKEERAGFTKIGNRPFTKNQIEYGCKDVAYLHEIKAKQEIKAKELGLESTIALENQVVKALADIELNGMGFNSKAWTEIALQTALEAQGLKENLDNIILNDRILNPLYKPEYVQGDLFGFQARELKINYASPAQILKICHQLGYKIESTDEQHLASLKKKHEFFKVLIDLRGKNKIVSTYGESFLDYIHPVTGRIHTSFWQVVETGRVSSGSKSDNSPNVQNLPSDNRFRNCFIAKKGYLWVSSDYSGQEMRLMADASGESGFINVLNSGEDIHCFAGSKMFNKLITKEDKELRYQAKTINFGKPYGMGTKKLSSELEISIEEAEKLFKDYAESFPKLNKWLENQGNRAKKQGYSVTLGPIPRKRFYPELLESQSLRKSVQRGDKETWKKILMAEGQVERNGANSPIQGAGANMIKEALIEVRELTKSYNNRFGANSTNLINTVHDAIDDEVIAEEAKKFAKEKEEIMIEIGNKYVSKVKTEVDTTITKFWTK